MVEAKVKSVSDIITAASGRQYKFVYFESTVETKTVNGEERVVRTIYDREVVDHDLEVTPGEWLRFIPTSK